MTVSTEKVSVPGKFDVFVGFADRLNGQEQDRQIGGHARDRAAQMALIDERVDADGQMRSVLFDRRDRQDGDDIGHIGVLEILPAHLGPYFRWQHGIPQFLPVFSRQTQDARAATASISILNSGRAKPCTISSVEAGGGTPMNSSRTFM